MNKIKLLAIASMCSMLSMTTLAQTVSLIPNWEVGDTASYSFKQKVTKKSGKESSVVTNNLNIDLKVVDKNSEGYILNATYHNLTSNDKFMQALYSATENLSFDYKLDINGRLIGLADSTKAINDSKLMLEQASKKEPILLLVSKMMTGDMYVSGFLEDVNYIHSLNGYTFELKNTIEYPIKKSTMFGPIAASNNYTLESVKGNIVNVKSTSVMENDILIPALVDFSMEKIKGIKDGMSGLIQSKDENMDEKKFMENQRIEIEQNIKQNFDLTMMDKFKYSYNKSTQWIASLEGITTLKGKVKDKDTNVVTEITIKKK